MYCRRAYIWFNYLVEGVYLDRKWSLIMYTAHLFIGERNLINDEGFRKALYMIDIGQNDIADSFAKNLSYAQVIKRIPSFIAEIKNALKVIGLIILHIYKLSS